MLCVVLVVTVVCSTSDGRHCCCGRVQAGQDCDCCEGCTRLLREPVSRVAAVCWNLRHRLACNSSKITVRALACAQGEREFNMQAVILIGAMCSQLAERGRVGVADVRRQSVRAHSKDWHCRTRVTPARLPWRAHVARVPRLRQRQSFSRTLLSQK